MAITNPQAVKFSNEQARPMADLYAQLYYALKTLTDTWDAQVISSVITNTSDVIEDGFATDGRASITGAMVTGLITNAKAFCADLEANTKLKLNGLLKIAVNPQR